MMACYMQYSQASHYCNTAVPYPFGLGLNPNGNLESLAENAYIHMEDNSVQYLQKQVDEDESVKYVLSLITRERIPSFVPFADISTSIQFVSKREISPKLLFCFPAFASHQVP